MALKYKIGDKVRIKSLDWYNKNKTSEFGDIDCGVMPFMCYMAEFCNKIVTISNVNCKDEYYEIEEDNAANGWTDEMIEGVAAKFKPNDIVDTNDNLYGCITDDIEYDEDKKSFRYYVSFIVDGGYYYESQLKPHKPKNKPDMGEVSDGYHTFNELYEYRALYNAAFFNGLVVHVEKTGDWVVNYDVHKSKKHSDGEDCFGGGWFIVMAELPTGQISNHYPMKDWDLFNIPEKEKANKWDGHTPQDVAKRMREFLTPKSKYPKTYEECSLINSAEDRIPLRIIGEFTRLINARNAYWKIAGEEMGLGKPWKPEYKTLVDNTYFTIHAFNGEIVKRATSHRNAILAFPTEEMRDAFYENFKEQIEQCKELL
ncbi:MAG: hypothetical protein J6V44_12775 [Methanobrevibacter sp.]|nr:hypothetical protein [Methanobrevibacter sp.]